MTNKYAFRSWIPGASRTGDLHLPYFFVLLLLIGFGLAIARGVANTLFLKRYGIDYLPFVFLVQGLTLSLSSVVYATVADRHPPGRVMGAILGISIVGMLFFWFAARAGAPEIVWGGLYLLYETAAETLAMHATLYIGATFYGEQAKRAVPIATAGGPVGDMFGGLALIILAPRLGTEITALAWPLALCAALLLLLAWHRNDVGSAHSAPRSRPWAQTLRQLNQGGQFLRRSPLLRYASIAVLFTILAVFISAYLFKRTFAETFADAESLATLYGVIIFVSGASAFVLQSGLVPGMIRRFGLRTMNLVFPLTLLGVLVALLSPWTLAAATAAAYNRYVLLSAIRNPVRALMLQALPDSMQGRSRALVLVVVAPLGMILSGLILALWHNATTLITLIGIAAALAGVWCAWRANQAYGEALLDTLRERHFVAPEHLTGWNEHGGDHLATQLIGQLNHENTDAAESAARVLLAHFPDRAVEPILNRLQSAPLPLRDRLAHALAPLLQADQRDALYDALLAGDTHAQASALIIGLRHGWPLPWARIDPSNRDDHPRLMACRWASSLTDDSDPEILNKIRESVVAGDPLLRRAMLTTLTAVPVTSTQALLLEALEATATPEQARPVLEALAAMNEPIPATTAAKLHSLLAQTQDVAGQSAILAVVQHLPLEEKFPLLLQLLNSAHPKVGAGGTAQLRSLSTLEVTPRLRNALRDGTLGPRGQLQAMDIISEHVDAAELRALGAEYAHRAASHAALAAQLTAGETAGSELLQIALQERSLDLRRLGLATFSRSPLQGLARTLRAALESTDLRLLARCQEAIDMVADDTARTILRALFAKRPLHAPLPDSSDLAAAINELRHGPDPWLAACAAQWSD